MLRATMKRPGCIEFSEVPKPEGGHSVAGVFAHIRGSP